MKRRLLVFILVLCLIPGSFLLASAESNELIEMFRTEYEIINPDYDDFYEYRYVSEDGEIEKWYCSYLPEIDGLKRTEEKRWLEFWNDPEEICDIEQEHAHLHFERGTGFFRPSFNEEETDSQGMIKLKPIVTISREALQVLNDYNLYRLSDLLTYMPADVENAKKGARQGLIYLIPNNINGDTFELDVVLYNSDTANYTADMNGWLVSWEYSYASELFDPDKDRTMVFEKIP